tara:strand:- start:319 stop:435 length:117 start_codon:yes stop_codon:yes gene_type:complete
MNQEDDFIFTVRVSITVIAAGIAIFVALVFGKEKDDDE